MADALVAEGVTTVFGVLGGGDEMICDLVDRGVRYVSACHEQGAVGMADGYARVTGGPGVAVVAQGPGLTNSGTALTAARLSGTPVMLIAADRAPGSRFTNMDIDQPPFIASTAGAMQAVSGPATVGGELATAFRHLRHGLGPIVVDVPYSLFGAEMDPEWTYTPPSVVTAGSQRVAPDPQLLEVVDELIASAQRPLVLAGRGAVRADAREALVTLADRIGALLATSLLAKGWFAGHPFDVGLSGGFASDDARRILREADLVLAFGASLNAFTTEYGSLYSSAAVVHVDCDPTRPGETIQPAVAVVADARAAAEAISAGLGGRKRTGWRSDDLAARVAAIDPADGHEAVHEPGVVDRFEVARLCDRLLPRERQVVVGIGHFMGAPAARISVPEPDALVLPWRLGAIGAGLPVALGAALGRPERTTVLFEGDGSLMIALAELQTAIRHDIPLLVVCEDDGSYAAERFMLRLRGRPDTLARLANPDFAALAEVFGFRTRSARSADELEAVLHDLGPIDRPTFLHVPIHPEVWDPAMDRALGLG